MVWSIFAVMFEYETHLEFDQTNFEFIIDVDCICKNTCVPEHSTAIDERLISYLDGLADYTVFITRGGTCGFHIIAIYDPVSTSQPPIPKLRLAIIQRVKQHMGTTHFVDMPTCMIPTTPYDDSVPRTVVYASTPFDYFLPYAYKTMLNILRNCCRGRKNAIKWI